MRTMPMGRMVAVALCAALVLPASARAQSDPRVAVASSLRQAMPVLIAEFERGSDARIRPSYASSGKLTRQILQGAPFELFLAADSAYPRRVAKAGVAAGEPTVYARGRIGLYVPAGSPLVADGQLDALAERLDAAGVERFAIAHPAHAPYGARARQALQRAGLWDAIQPVLVLGENAAQAARFAASGSVDGAILPASLATRPELADRGEFAPVPPGWYQPLAQSMVRLEGAGHSARRFHRFMQGPAAARILREHGFAVPGEDG